ncbi:MAG: hypothetical protein J6Y85_03395 [Alphaproteobacteria bacterium]|nr:hypothetical protein [Alphaproteobacteria bacterium]
MYKNLKLSSQWRYRFMDLAPWLAFAVATLGTACAVTAYNNAGYNAQNNPAFERMLKEHEGIVVDKGIEFEHPCRVPPRGVVYLAMDNGNQARMAVPLTPESSMRLNTLRVGSQGSLQEFKEIFEEPNKDFLKPQDYVKFSFMQSEHQK